MTLNQLNSGLTKVLKKYIKANHIDTGALYKSIRFKCELVDDSLVVKFNTLEYLKFLEKGKFLENFYQLPEVRQLFADFIQSYIEGELFN